MSTIRFAIAASLLVASLHLVHSAESWSDPRLTSTNGLLLWLDVSRQTAARGASGLTPLQSWNDAPDVLLDGSGNKRHLVQPLLNARPRFRQEFNGAMLSFDGTNDFLTAETLSSIETNVAVFVVAAPRSNAGFFRGLFSFSAAGKNDYTTGLNLDLGGEPSSGLSFLNLEGGGIPGQQNFLSSVQPFGHWHVFALMAQRGPKGVKLFLDGQAQGTRDRTADSTMRLDEMTLGARRYSNTPDRPHVQGFFHGEFAEMLVFNRALADSERAEVQHYLDTKYGALLHSLVDAPVREGAVPLIAVTNPPPIQFHFPGFSTRELPLNLNNINNVRYRSDGKLIAVGYDGRVWLLSDTDGDGLEDKIEPFWDRQTIRAPIGAALTPANYARGQGVFMAGKGKVVLLLDTNRDDRADEEITVATWTEPSEQHGVDGLGVAVGPDGSVYFSLGAASFTEPFLIDKSTGLARYRISMDRGTIQRVTPDFSKRETVCTGIRFAVGMAFNHNGDLFCTDQEGATWLHDGNPLDELLHIQTGRHYGFPPRHPTHLPNVFDEPSVFDYAPQHQSTCGLQFNRASGILPGEDSDSVRGVGSRSASSRQDAGGTFFGPDFWKDDAIVSGYSRGKIWRTKLVKTAVGYVAQTHLLATLQALTLDVTVSPRGDLIVATHSGQPDWGSGPNGKGKLWRVRYDDTNAPQPAAAWNASATDLCVAFDRPVQPQALRDLMKQARIESGQFVFPGDRFETIRPGYQVVYDQLAAPRHTHEILSTQLSPDRRTLTLVTRPRTAAVNYVVTLPQHAQAKSPARGDSIHPQTDLLSSLNGVEAVWKSADGKSTWSGWLPHVDLQVAREFTAKCAEQERLFALIANRGTLTLRGQLDLFQMLQPAIQPGAKIDWERPAENIKITLEADREFTAKIGAQSVQSSGVRPRTELTLNAPGSKWHLLEINLPTGDRVPELTMTWSTDEDPRVRAFPLRRFLMPWAQPAEAVEKSSSPAERFIPEIAGGNWLHGKRLFFSEQIACSKCHVIRGEGGRVGPDLSNLIYRDYASVKKDVQFPNAAMNPDHVASNLELTGGESVNGIILMEKADVIQLAMANGGRQSFPRTRVKSVKPAQLSLMPEGIWDAMTDVDRRDLMTFLLTLPLEPHPLAPVIQGNKMPEPRKRAEVERVISSARESSKQTGMPVALRIVLCAAPKDAGHNFPGLHDYPIWRERWSKLLALADNVTVETSDRWPSNEQWNKADVIAFFSDNPGWAAERAGDPDAFLARGGGLVLLHWAVNGGKDAEVFAQRIGLAWGAGARFRHGVEDLKLASHEVTRGLPSTLSFVDETYWNLKPGGDVTVLATSLEEGAPQPQVWIRESGRGRVFACIPGHFTWTFDDPLFRVLLLRGMAWSARQSLDRFNELISIGARIQD